MALYWWHKVTFKPRGKNITCLPRTGFVDHRQILHVYVLEIHGWSSTFDDAQISVCDCSLIGRQEQRPSLLVTFIPFLLGVFEALKNCVEAVSHTVLFHYSCTIDYEYTHHLQLLYG